MPEPLKSGFEQCPPGQHRAELNGPGFKAAPYTHVAFEGPRTWSSFLPVKRGSIVPPHRVISRPHRTCPVNCPLLATAAVTSSVCEGRSEDPRGSRGGSIPRLEEAPVAGSAARAVGKCAPATRTEPGTHAHPSPRGRPCELQPESLTPGKTGGPAPGAVGAPASLAPPSPRLHLPPPSECPHLLPGAGADFLADPRPIGLDCSLPSPPTSSRRLQPLPAPAWGPFSREAWVSCQPLRWTPAQG